MISFVRGLVAGLLAFIIFLRITQWYYDAEAPFDFFFLFNLVLPAIIGAAVGVFSWHHRRHSKKSKPILV